MAEILGIIGVAPLAIQLLEKTSQLSTFLRSIKDAPDEIQDMMLEVEILSETLQQFGESQLARNNMLPASGPVLKAIKACEDLSCVIQLELDKATAMIETSKSKGSKKFLSVASIKVARRKESISRLMPRMRRVIALLQLASQNLLHVKFDQIFVHISKEQPSFSSGQSSLQLVRSQPSAGSWGEMASYWFGLATIHTQRTRSQVYQHNETRDVVAKSNQYAWRFHFYLSQWLGGCGISIYAPTISSSWQYVFKPCYLVKEEESPIFDACYYGDYSEVLRLLDSRQATPFDFTAEGRSPLHEAAWSTWPDICRLLIDRGADANEIYNFRFGTPMMAVAHSSGRNLKGTLGYQEDMLRRLKDTIRVLVEQGRSDPMIGSSLYPNVFCAWSGPAEPFNMLRFHDEVVIDEYEWLGVGSFGSVYHFLARTYNLIGDKVDAFDPAGFLDSVWSKKNASQFTTIRDRNGNTVLHSALQGLETSYNVHESSGNLLDYQLKLIGRLLETGLDVHAEDRLGHTAFDHLVFQVLSDHFEENKDEEDSGEGPEDGDKDAEEGEESAKACEEGERNYGKSPETLRTQLGTLASIWLKALYDLGIDVTQYWQEEKAIHPNGYSYVLEDIIIFVDLTPKIISFAEAPKVEWAISSKFVSNFEDNGGTGTPNMPGSWQERSSVYNRYYLRVSHLHLPQSEGTQRKA